MRSRIRSPAGANTIDYDQLVIALGSSTSTFGLPGVAERVFALKTLEDAGILRNRLVWLLELADTTSDAALRRRYLTVVVVGGGFTGVEATGEFVELFHSVLRFYPSIDRAMVRIVLIEGGPVLLPGLPPRMGSYSAAFLSKRGVEILTGDGVASADDDGIVLQSGARIETATIVWSAGVAPAPTIGGSPLPRTKRGAIIVGRDFRVEGYDDIWALGDCAAIPDGDGGFYPLTAQHAIREGPVLADNIVATLRGEATKPFHLRRSGSWRRSVRGARSRSCPAGASSPGSRRGSSGARTISRAYRAWIASCASRSIGRSKCSFRATLPSCACIRAKRSQARQATPA